MADVEYSSSASLMGRIPLTIFTTSGTLRLASGRLAFVKSRNRVVFDHPVQEIHSVTPAARVGLYLWHGTQRYRLINGPLYIHGVETGNDLLDVALGAERLSRSLAADAAAREVRGDWMEILQPLTGDPPLGMKVPTPWPTWAWLLACVGVTLVIVAIVTVLTFTLS